MTSLFRLLLLLTATGAYLGVAACGDDDSNGAARSAGSAGGASGAAGTAGSTLTGGSAGSLEDASAGSAGADASTDDASDAAQEPEEKHAAPPSAGAQKPGDGNDAVFAISSWRLGDTMPDGTPDNQNAWRVYGYDIDRKLSTATSTDLCKPRNNAAPQQVYPDGADGIDNSFGKNILPIYLGLFTDVSSIANEALQQGMPRPLLYVEKLGTAADYNPLAGRLYKGAELGAAPKYDGTDQWPVVPDFLNDPSDITSAKVKFATAWMTDNTWVSGEPAQFQLKIDIPHLPLELPLSSAIITMTFDASHKTAKGIISGVLPVDAFVAAFRKNAGLMDASLCSGPTIDSIVAQLESAADIMVNGSQDPTQQCNGISIGLGFEAALVQLGGVSTPEVQPPDPCAP